MKTLIAFIKKEITEQIRTGKLFITLALFTVLGIMNPAIAKLTPWLLELFADDLAENGMIITDINVSAMDSWVQFFKNIPIGLIAFVLLNSAIFTREYSSGTLVLSLTKGLERVKVLISKALTLITAWTLGYWICFWITYFYNSYYWDNSVARDLALSVVCWWLFGLFVISVMTFFSTALSSNSGVLLGTGAIIALFYILELVPKVHKYMPTFLMNGASLIFGEAEACEFIAPFIVTAVLVSAFFTAGIPVFNKKQL